jgi:Nucleotidyl transferase
MFGVEPTRPATEYGYIRTGHSIRPGLFAIDRFVEKPDAETAARYVADGYLWNSGNFMFRAHFLLDEYRHFEPDSAAAVAAALESAGTDLGFVTLGADAFALAAAKSIDYAVMERTARAAVMPVSYGWSDVGSWQAVWELVSTKTAGPCTAFSPASRTDSAAPTWPPRNSSLHYSASKTWSSSLPLTRCWWRGASRATDCDASSASSRRSPPSPRKSGQDRPGADRGADRQLSRRGRHRAHRGRLSPALSTTRAPMARKILRVGIAVRQAKLARSRRSAHSDRLGRGIEPRSP